MFQMMDTFKRIPFSHIYNCTYYMLFYAPEFNTKYYYYKTQIILNFIICLTDIYLFNWFHSHNELFLPYTLQDGRKVFEDLPKFKWISLWNLGIKYFVNTILLRLRLRGEDETTRYLWLELHQMTITLHE